LGFIYNYKRYLFTFMRLLRKNSQCRATIK
jgi:hypothetical protein